jgi:thioredoxin 1
MTKGKRLAIIGMAVALVAAALVLRELHRSSGGSGVNPASQAAGDAAAQKAALPRLIDLGSDQCIPCKMMAPILEELKQEYKGRMEVEVIDVRKNRAVGIDYGIRVIPTQIFVASSGDELFRHEGFISKEDILAKWRELGVDVEAGGSSGRKG